MTGVEPELGRLEKLYVQHGPVALATAFLLLGDRAQAEDAVQEAFLRLLGRFRHVRTPEAFDSYLRRTVVNLCLNQLRRRRVERAYFER